MAMYTAAKSFRHDRESFQKGDPIDLDDTQAQTFRDRGFIEVDEKTKKQTAAERKAAAKAKAGAQAESDAKVAAESAAKATVDAPPVK